MKRVVLVLLCMASMAAMAQKDGKHQRDAMDKMTPEQRATLKTKKMTLALDLTDAQQKQIQQLHLEDMKTRKSAMEARKAERKNGESEKRTSEERYAMMNDRLDRMIAHKTEMKEILSDEQYERWEKMAMRKQKHRKGKKKDHRSRK